MLLESVVFSATSSFRTTISSTDFSKKPSLTNFRNADHLSGISADTLDPDLNCLHFPFPVISLVDLSSATMEGTQ